MSNTWPRPGLGMVGEYQRSGLPFVTSSNGAELKTATSNVVQISFPRVTRWFEVRGLDASNSTAEIRIGFTENGVKGEGAVTGSIPTGEFTDTTGNQKFVKVEPLPSTEAQKATHANYFVIPSAETSEAPAMRYELMCTDLFLTMHSAHNSGFCVIAGLTDIPRSSLNLTGSAGYQGVG
tara:strand:- start:9496 stop:10032 length:537 start_codon:yes stop_codon:yes gene_type:complete